MKVIKRSLIFLMMLLSVTACKKKDLKLLSDGVQEGEQIVINKGEIDQTVNVEGGDVHFKGDTEVSGDINIQKEGGGVYVGDNVTVNKINMNNGIVTLAGNSSVDTDFNFNGGKVYVGDDKSTIEDTVRIKGNFNAYGEIIIRAGVLVVESDFNLNKEFVSVENDAKLIIDGTFNHNDQEVYGTPNIEIKGAFNGNISKRFEEPYDEDKD